MVSPGRLLLATEDRAEVESDQLMTQQIQTCVRLYHLSYLALPLAFSFQLTQSQKKDLGNSKFKSSQILSQIAQRAEASQEGKDPGEVPLSFF